MVNAQYIASVDQGTASSRCLIFDASARVVSVSQKEHHHIFPRPGWVEHDPREIWANVLEVVHGALQGAQLQPERPRRARDHQPARDHRAVGPRRPASRCTTRSPGRTCARTGWSANSRGDEGQDRFKERCGLPLATYFSAPKIRWLLDSLPGLRERAEAGEVLFGTMDSWLIWNLTGRHVTDATNASRTMLMNLGTLDWDDELLGRVRRAARDAAGDPLLLGGLRRGRRARGRAGRVGAR